MTKKELQKIFNHLVNTVPEECTCYHCASQENGTYLDGIITALQ